MEALLLGPIRFYQSCILLIPKFIRITGHEEGANISARSPGDMLISLNLKSEKMLPGPGVWAPLQAGVTGVPQSRSTAQEP